MRGSFFLVLINIIFLTVPSCVQKKTDLLKGNLDLFCREIEPYTNQSCKDFGDYVILKTSSLPFYEEYLISIVPKQGYGSVQLNYLDTTYNLSNDDYLETEKEIIALKSFSMKLPENQMNTILEQITKVKNYDSNLRKGILDPSYYYIKSSDNITVGLKGYEDEDFVLLDSLIHTYIIEVVNGSLVPWKDRVPSY